MKTLFKIKTSKSVINRKNSPYSIGHRTLMSVTNVVRTVQKVNSHVPRTVLSRNYILTVRQPPLICDTKESYKNNPICTVKKYDPSQHALVKRPIRHPEAVRLLCKISDCATRICFIY